MTNTHLDMNEIIREEIKSRRQNSVFGQQPQKAHTTISMEGALLNAEYGPQQVESLLRYVVDFPLEKAMSDAEDISNAVRQLRLLKG